jgi:uncharacterized protein YbjT (DUF2867 family)
MFAMVGRWGVLPVPKAPLQTVAAVDVARAVADVAEAPARRGRVEVAGPELVDARDLARRWRSGTGRRAVLLPIPLPGAFGRTLRSGALITEHPDVRGTTPFASWLATQQR